MITANDGNYMQLQERDVYTDMMNSFMQQKNNVMHEQPGIQIEAHNNNLL